MKKPTLIDILSNPFILAAVFILPGIIYLETTIQKYVSETITKFSVSPNDIYRYDDLDGDGQVELVRTKHNINGEAAVVVEKDGQILDQINIGGKFPGNHHSIFIGDYNMDEKKELFVFTHTGTKIWLHYLNVFDTIHKKIYIDSVWIKEEKYDFTISMFGLKDMNGDGVRDLVFNINGGFSVYPRRVYYYDIKNDSLTKSIAFGSKGSINQIIDIDGDLIPELLMTSTAVDNMKGNYDFPWPDNHSWIMVFDNRLQYKFQPADAGGLFSYCNLYFIHTQGKDMLIAWQNTRTGDKTIKTRNLPVQVINSKGAIEKTNEIELTDHNIKANVAANNRLLLFEQDMIYTIDTLLQKKKLKNCKQLKGLYPRISKSYHTGNYFLFTNLRTNMFYFVDKDFNYVIPTNIQNKSKQVLVVSQLENDNGNPQFVMQTGNELTRFIIKKNPHYIYRFGYYGGAYLILLSFIILIRWLQRGQIQRRQALEKEMARLQFASLKNQLEPHFTMNVLNAISGYVLKNTPDKAYDYIVRFSRMIHSTLKESDVFQRALHEEIDFVTDYLELQKLRFRHNLEYKISIDKLVDPRVEVPKMLIQSHVENAIKHGLKSRDGKGTINIAISKNYENLVISIADDGIGRKAAAKFGTDGTGKGLETMQKYYRIFKSLTGKSVSHEVKDLVNEKGEPVGTEVIVKVSKESGNIKGSRKGRLRKH